MFRNRMLITIGAASLFACANGAEPKKATTTKTAAAQQAPETKKSTDGSGDPTQRVSPDTVVATWKGGKMTYGELLEANKGEFRKMRNDYRTQVSNFERQRLEGAVVQKLVQAAAKAKGMEEEAYLKAEVGDVTVTDEEIKAFHASNPQIKDQPLDTFKDRIKGFLEQQKQQRAYLDVFERLKKENAVKVELPKIELEKVEFDLAGRPVKGKTDAKVTIVEFSDFECPFCSRAVDGVEKLVKAYPDSIKVVFMHFPLSMHPRALPAAIASQCANQQGKFWEYHDKLFENQRAMSDEQLASYAKDAGLDVDKFKTCFAAPETKAFVQKDMDQGTEAGVQGTPTFFVNGEPQRGVPTVDDIKPFVEG